MLARAFVQQKSNTIGVVMGDPSGYPDTERIRGANSFFDKKGYTLLISTKDGSSDMAEMHLKAFLSKRIDGLIVMDPYCHIPDRCFLQLAEEGVPVVLLERDIEDKRIPCVHIGDFNATRSAIEHLIGHGHKKIGFISGPLESKPIRESLEAYRGALAEAGLAFDERCIVEGDWLSPSGYMGMEDLLGRDLGITAMFAANDAMALGAMRATYDHGLRMPEDIAILGFDNVPVLAPYLQPALSTVDNPFFLIGRTCAAILYDLLDGRECPHSTIIPVGLVLRESCGCTGPNSRNDSLEVRNGNHARTIGEQMWVEMREQVVSVVWGDACYLQNKEGTSGLGLSWHPAVSSLNLSPGDVVSVGGRLGTIRHERVLRDPYVRVTGRTGKPVPSPVEVADLRNGGCEDCQGVLVETRGTVTSVDNTSVPRRITIAGREGLEVAVQTMETDYDARVGEKVRAAGVWIRTVDGIGSIRAVSIRAAETQFAAGTSAGG